jgi:TrmH family RNA methyltransferase
VNSVDPYNPKTVKSSMSAVFHMNIYTAETVQEVLKIVREFGAKLICADAGGKNIFALPKPDKFALVVGNEGTGVGQVFLAAADSVVSIPMDERVESLNAAAAAAVLLYQLKGDK